MNFKSLFNKKYFKENIKKSKGLLAFVLGIIPLINIILLIIMELNAKNHLNLLEFKSISIFTNLGQYFIPLVLAVSLFGFVFKQKSVDFVMSKPLSRKTIYQTNLLGGIFIIFLFVLINAGIYAVASVICQGLIIPLAIIVDYFIYWFISYIFLFTVSSLAISLAGNVMGSLVVVLLIICMAPFLYIEKGFIETNHNYSHYVKCNDKSCIPSNYECQNNNVCIEHLAKNEYRINAGKEYNMTLTSPFAGLNNVAVNDSYYESASVFKMLVLSIIYSLIGYIIFIKRKMENNEVSFKNSKLHYIIKTLTMLPVCFIIYMIIKESAGIGLIVGIVASLIYYFLYDLITRKEIYQPLKSAMICVCTLGVLLGFYTCQDTFDNNVIVLDKPKTLNIYGIEIKDQNLINKMLKETLDTNQNYQKSYITLYKNYNYNFHVSPETAAELEKVIDTNREEEFKKYDYDKVVYLDNDVPVTKELKKILKEAITKYDYKTFKIENQKDSYFRIYQYNNHHYETTTISYGLDKKLDKYLMDYKNKQYISFLKEGSQLEFEINPRYLSKEDYYLMNYILEKNLSKFQDYLETKNNVFDQENTTLNVYTRNGYMTIIITSVPSFKEELNKYKEALKNDSRYNYLLKSIHDEEETDEEA